MPEKFGGKGDECVPLQPQTAEGHPPARSGGKKPPRVEKKSVRGLQVPGKRLKFAVRPCPGRESTLR